MATASSVARKSPPHPVNVWLYTHQRDQQWLARRLGIHRVSLNRILRGRRQMTRGMAERIAAAIGETLDYVIGPESSR